MKKQLSFFDTIRISLFDFKSYVKFLDMPFLKVILNRVIFILLIGIANIAFINKDVEFLNQLNENKQTIFEDINYTNGILNIKNSPTIYTPNDDFILIGDTRDKYEIDNYNNYKTALVLLKDSFIFKEKLNSFEIKYSDILLFNELSGNNTLHKETIFLIIDSLSHLVKHMLYVALPILLIFNYFFVAFASALLATLLSIICTYIIKVKAKFSQVFKLMLFAQTAPYIVISIFDLLAKVNGILFVFPVHLLEIFTLIIFFISMVAIKKNTVKDK